MPSRARFAASAGGRRAVALFLAAALLFPQAAYASEIVLKDGRRLEGNLVPLASIGASAAGERASGAVAVKPILMCDDGLRRTFIPKREVQSLNEGQFGPAREQFNILHQPVARVGARVAAVGPLRLLSPFDEHGRRSVEMVTSRGPLVIHQGATVLDPLWTKLDALHGDGAAHIWDQRIATSSIPFDLLDKVIHQQLDPDDLDQRLKVVRFYLQMERFEESRKKLADVMTDFPEHAQRLTGIEQDLRQGFARRLLAELDYRRAAGQHQRVRALLASFPKEGVAGETLQQVRAMVQEYDAEAAQGAELLKRIDADLQLVADPMLREKYKPLRDEIAAELNYNTLERLNAFKLAGDDAELTPEDRLALAGSGWLVGANSAERRLPVALSMLRVRNEIVNYLTTDEKLERDAILARLASEEGAVPESVAKLLAHMKPPYEVSANEMIAPGMFRFEVSTYGDEPPISYLVQLPPEYDPHRIYPTIVTLRGAGTSAELQIDWWAGGWNEERSERFGQATRHGYIVVAPDWAADQQPSYRYSALEHAAVLNSLRDAARRFSVDPDRVYLSGHSMGGDAAWDIGLAHPDLWAGVLPIAARADRYVTRYWPHGDYVPMYVVGGELDAERTAKNAVELDRYLRHSLSYDMTVVEYLGRGHENFSDEILRIFDWMGRKRRAFAMREFEVLTMRPWDNYFWWLELGPMPEKTQVMPADWPPERGVRPASTKAQITPGNTIYIQSAADQLTLWLSPDVIDFKQRLKASVNGGRVRLSEPFAEPDIRVMLEDVRTRGDRMHPFWTKISVPSGEFNVAGR